MRPWNGLRAHVHCGDGSRIRVAAPGHLAECRVLRRAEGAGGTALNFDPEGLRVADLGGQVVGAAFRGVMHSGLKNASHN
ncbi:hypothetical protein [Streptomyces sp. NPDC059649]|uniref:hypothetical protein n=1 Tax=Streptomyces sp. NPDC059649 TaxID=3346895 RepID=UPI0036B9E302